MGSRQNDGLEVSPMEYLTDILIITKIKAVNILTLISKVCQQIVFKSISIPLWKTIQHFLSH
jgi:hypothetical protein